jgi:hypothetical protein
MEKWPNFKKQIKDATKQALFVAGITAASVGGVKAQEVLPDNGMEKTKEMNEEHWLHTVVESSDGEKLKMSFSSTPKKVGDDILLVRDKGGRWRYAPDQNKVAGFEDKIFRVEKTFLINNLYSVGIGDSIANNEIEYKKFKIVELEDFDDNMKKLREERKNLENSEEINEDVAIKDTLELPPDEVFDVLEENINPEEKPDYIKVQIMRGQKRAEIVYIDYVEGVLKGDNIYVNHRMDIVNDTEEYKKASADEDYVKNFLKKNTWGDVYEIRKAKVLGFVKKDKKENDSEKVSSL